METSPNGWCDPQVAIPFFQRNFSSVFLLDCLEFHNQESTERCFQFQTDHPRLYDQRPPVIAIFRVSTSGQVKTLRARERKVLYI